MLQNVSPLQIKMFDEFSVKNAHFQYPSGTKKNRQLTTLVAYLLANRNVEVSREKLYEVLWPQEGNSGGALRNLVYRARQAFAPFFPGEKVDCILLKNNTYAWNPDIPCTLDIDAFDENYRKATAATDDDAKYAYLKEAARLYAGDFLADMQESEWVAFASMYYQRKYMECILCICDYLKAHARYEEILDLVDGIGKVDRMYEKIHEYYLEALLATGQSQRAMDYYYYVVDLFYCKLGVDVTGALHDVYTRIVEVIPDYKVSIRNLEDRLREDTQPSGSFYCNYEVFKNIYRFNARSIRRARNARFLILLSLEDRRAGSHQGEEMAQQMEMLKQIIFEQLRRNDVFTRFSATQFSVILSAQNQDNCMIAINRIVERYNHKNKCADIRILWDVKQIEG
nr:BTAD domain-containing putative transcriptional regulator [Maliibacterium massiliense]